MRGKIIQYNGADGSGTLVIDGAQYRFALTAWRGDSAPTLNKVVEVMLDGETVSAVVAVGEDVLLKEKAADLKDKMGSLLNKIPKPAAATATATANGSAPAADASAAAIHAAPAGADFAGSLVQRYGKVLLGTYVLYLMGTLMFNAVQVSLMGPSIGKSFFDVATLMSQFGGGGGGVKAMLLLAYASIALPMLWRDRRAWLVLALPLLVLLWATYSVLHTFDSFGGGMGAQMADAFSLGFGFYLSFATALVLAVLGFKQFVRNA